MFICRELLLNNNLLRVLPNEIGKLFHLHILGLHGNPLGKEVLSIYNDSNGSHKLLTYLLDNLSGEWHIAICCGTISSFHRFAFHFSVVNAPPPQRPWIPLARPNRTRPACKCSAQCFWPGNGTIQMPFYVSRHIYGYVL